jgi:uncharacterized LabA/DUF88 family protein
VRTGPRFQRVAVFVDFANVNRASSDAGILLEYDDLLQYLAADRHLVEAIAYVPIDPHSPAARDAECENLWLSGYFVKTKLGKPAGDTFKCNVDVEMTIDMLNAALVMEIDTAVIVSGDGDFVPVIEYLRGRGIRAEVCGFHSNTAREMILKSSGYIDLDHYLAERTADTDLPGDEEQDG